MSDAMPIDRDHAQPPTRSALPEILLGMLVVGTLDLIFATSFWALRGVSPIRICQSIAAGLLGREAFTGGNATAALGVCLHFVISLGIVAVYWAAARIWPSLTRKRLLYGIGYGIVAYAVMTWIVVPLSAAPGSSRFNPPWVISSIAAHMFLIGMPAAFFGGAAARRAGLFPD